MKGSEGRIITTHTGSLPRPRSLLAPLHAKDSGDSYDRKILARDVRAAVTETVGRQVKLGIDVVDDGEVSKSSFATYANSRIGGLQLDRRPPRHITRPTRDALEFPKVYEEMKVMFAARMAHAGRLPDTTSMVCTGPIKYIGQDDTKADLDNLKAALKGVNAAEAFVPSIAPSNIETTTPNEYYPNQEAYVFAIAEAMREEYKAIVDAGFLLQIDDPFLVTYYITRPDLSIAECRKWGELRVEALNAALKDIPADRVRFHTCYSINMGPRIHDMQLKDVIDIILKVNAGAYTFEAANPRHEHEWDEWRSAKTPDDKVLIPGVITQSTVLVEHPELVAQRLCRFADVVGRERVIAGADCGFASFAGSNEVHPSIVWAKFNSLVEGARIASKKLWKK